MHHFQFLRHATLALALAHGACSQASSADSSRAPSTAPAPAVPYAAPRDAAPPDTDAIVLSGELRPDHAAELSFRAGGRLATVEVALGERVEAGQVLARLATAEARAQLAQARAALAAARAQADLADDDLARTRILAERGATPAAQLRQAELRVAGATAAVRQAEAGVALARASLDGHVVRAPFAGQIVRVPDGIGATLAPGVPVLRIEDLRRLVLRTTVAAAELPRVAPGAAATVTAPDGAEVPGRVRAIVPSLDAASRRAPVEIEVDNRAGSLVAGAFVRARIAAPGSR